MDVSDNVYMRLSRKMPNTFLPNGKAVRVLWGSHRGRSFHLNKRAAYRLMLRAYRGAGGVRRKMRKHFLASVANLRARPEIMGRPVPQWKLAEIKAVRESARREAAPVATYEPAGALVHHFQATA